MTERSTVADFYSAEAERYKEMWAPELLPLARALLPGLQLADAEYVLEVGAGVGAFLPEIYRAAPRATVLGVDLAEGMIALAPRDFPIAAMDATRLAFRDATFDAGILAFVLFHVPRPLDALQEMRRVLRSGATVATVTWGQDPGYRALEIWIEELEAHGAAPAESLARHELVDTPEKVTSLLSAAGFSSPHAWIGFYDRQMTPEEFLAHRTGHGSSRWRFESLGPESRVHCLDRARRRIQRLDSDGLRDRAEVVYAVGHR